MIKNKAAGYITGLEKKATCTRDSLRLGKETGRELSGGAMEVGTKDSLEMEFKADGEFSTDKAVIDNMRATGIMECSTAKEFSISRTDSATRAPSNKTNSTVKEYSTKTTP